jgi:KaiC/GvpD/RAD55 family RecA-like ATPase
VSPIRSDVEALRWDAFQAWFRRAWVPGEHVALVGPTGTGKTTLACGILPLRKFVLAFDPKGGDSTLASLKRYGFERCAGWPPPRDVRRRVEKGEAARLIVGPVIRTREDLPKQKQVFERALDGAFDEGGWSVYVDELQLMADRRMLGLSTSMERILIAARDRGVSMVSSFQRPANVPRAAADQSSWIAVWYTRDVDVVNRVAEMVGRPKNEIRGAVSGLEQYSLLLFSRNPSDPIRVVRPPKV